MLCKIAGGHEREDVSLQALEARVVEGLDGRLFNRPVHSLGLTVRPRVIWLGQPMLNAILGADPIEDNGGPRYWSSLSTLGARLELAALCGALP
jgi:hypothetical protein